MGMKTCPGTWSILGEHTTLNETWDETALRGLNEELHLLPSQVARICCHPKQTLALTVESNACAGGAPIPWPPAAVSPQISGERQPRRKIATYKPSGSNDGMAHLALASHT